MMKKGAAGVQLHFAINSKKTIKNIVNAHASSSLQHQLLANWNFGEIRITYIARMFWGKEWKKNWLRSKLKN